MKDQYILATYSNQKDTNCRVLVYPNITYSKDLEKDSYIVVLKNTIEQINKVRDDIHWVVLTPTGKQVASLNLPNVEQREIEIPTYPNRMRTHFKPDEILKVIDWRNEDFDILYSHLPEQTLALTNLLRNTTNINPKVVGYCHWFEVDGNTNYKKRMLRQNLSGILEMDECGVNSIWLKELVIEESKKMLSEEDVERLKEILQPHYLGIDSISTDHEYEPKSILFNHRGDYYTGWKWFVKQMDELYKKRQDFKVYTTLEHLDRPYAEKLNISSREDYLKYISKMHMGVGCFKRYSAWSISTTDGLSQGVPYVLPNKLCYPEMVGKDYPLLYEEKDFLSTIENMLDNPNLRQEVKDYLEPKLPDFMWSNRVLKWFDNWKIFDEYKLANETDSYKKIKKLVKTNKTITKNQITTEFNWGVRIDLNGYRNRLRNEKDIRLTKNRYEVIEK
tara:strand:+ start:554 stop:1894 length:1341 start_codon:yes stop_codon:yes gene_type:complete